MNLQDEQAKKLAELSADLQELTRKAPAQTVLVPWAMFEVSTTYGRTANNTVLSCSAANLQNTLGRSLRTIRCWQVTAKVRTTNDASNYWNINIRELTSAGAFNTLSTLTTAAIAPNVWTSLDSGVVSVSYDSTASLGLVVYINKVGSPGTLDFLCPLVYVI